MVIAYILVRKEFPGKKFLGLVSMLAFAVPGTVVGIGYILAFNEPPLLLTGTATILVLVLYLGKCQWGLIGRGIFDSD